MGRTAAVLWHASFSLAAGVLYFFFVLPRTFELLGETSHTLGTALRIVTAALIGLAALPVLLTLLRTRRPELGTPTLALNLRTTSIALHVLAGLLILGTAISEIWLSVDQAGQWLFGIYGAAAAIALLGMLAFYLAFVAELPPPPPKPVKVTQRTSRRRKKALADDAEADTAADSEPEPETEAETETVADAEAEPKTAAEPKTEAEPKTQTDEPGAEDTAEPDADDSARAEDESDGDVTEPADPAAGKLQNQRPTGKNTLLRRRRRSRGGVAVED